MVPEIAGCDKKTVRLGPAAEIKSQREWWTGTKTRPRRVGIVPFRLSSVLRVLQLCFTLYHGHVVILVDPF